MFSDDFLGGFSIESTWKRDRSLRESSSQTDKFGNQDATSQMPITASVDSQTMPQDTESDQSFKFDKKRNAILQSSQFKRFLRQAADTTIKEIENSAANGGFEIICKVWRDLFDEGSRQAQLVQQFSLSSPFDELEATLDGSVKSEESKPLNFPNARKFVTAISWNCNASIVAVAYCPVSYHNDWCTHYSNVLLWNIYQASIKKSKPSVVLELDSCISALQAHPIQPSIYAAGSVNGKVALWNTRNEGDMLCCTSSTTRQDLHQERVTRLNWIRPTSGKSGDLGLLVSSSLDGKVIVWQIKTDLKAIEPQKGFVILTSDLPKSMSIKSSSRESEVGIVSLSFNWVDPSIFVIGCIGGGLFQSSILNELPATGYGDSGFGGFLEFKTANQMSFLPHKGHVVAVQFSPFSRNIFFSIGIDNELRIYNIMHSKPLIVLENEFQLRMAQWSPTRPNIVAITENGKGCIFVLKDNQTLKMVFDFGFGEQQQQPVTPVLMQFNEVEKFDEQIAIGTDEGLIQVWNLSTCTDSMTDANKISELFKSMTVDDD